MDDLRESPAITAVELLRDAGAIVTTFEPFKLDFQIEGVRNVSSLRNALKDAEIILLLVGHGQFKALAPLEVKNLSKANIVIDAVNGWDGEAWRLAGFKYFHLGDGKHRA